MAMVPIVNYNKCEGKGNCIHVCVQNVYHIQQISAEQYGKLSFIGKLKTIFSDGRKAVTVNPQACIECGKCVAACSEKAIALAALDA